MVPSRASLAASVGAGKRCRHAFCSRLVAADSSIISLREMRRSGIKQHKPLCTPSMASPVLRVTGHHAAPVTTAVYINSVNAMITASEDKCDLRIRHQLYSPILAEHFLCGCSAPPGNTGRACTTPFLQRAQRSRSIMIRAACWSEQESDPSSSTRSLRISTLPNTRQRVLVCV